MEPGSAIESVIEQAFPDLKLLSRLNKGWSSDIKFLLGSEDERKCLLRISESVSLERRYDTARMMQLALSAGISSPRPITCGRFPSGATYILQTWLEGCPLDELLSGNTEKSQYLLGSKAGKMLASLNNAQTDVEAPDFGMRKLRNLIKKLSVYSSNETLVLKADEALTYIHDNVDLSATGPPYPVTSIRVT